MWLYCYYENPACVPKVNVDYVLSCGEKNPTGDGVEHAKFRQCTNGEFVDGCFTFPLRSFKFSY